MYNFLVMKIIKKGSELLLDKILQHGRSHNSVLNIIMYIGATSSIYGLQLFYCRLLLFYYYYITLLNNIGPIIILISSLQTHTYYTTLCIRLIIEYTCPYN